MHPDFRRKMVKTLADPATPVELTEEDKRKIPTDVFNGKEFNVPAMEEWLGISQGRAQHVARGMSLGLV